MRVCRSHLRRDFGMPYLLSWGEHIEEMKKVPENAQLPLWIAGIAFFTKRSRVSSLRAVRASHTKRNEQHLWCCFALGTIFET